MNDYERVATVIRHLDRHHTERPDLTDRLGNFRARRCTRANRIQANAA
jgi:hypothetical protein